MKQIAAIFSKDVRHLWPEISISLALLAALVLDYPTTWRDGAALSTATSFSSIELAFSHSFLPGWLVILLPLGWWVLIARLIHTERLVGDTQFWLTRPYEWPKFLAAKLLFLACFICAPFLLAQGLLLGEAGFNPLPSIPGLLANLFAVFCMLVLPLIALSTITSSFGKLVLVLLGIFLFFVGEMTVAHSAGIPGPGVDLNFLIFIGGCVAVVIVQFATRNLRLAWLLVAGVPALLCILGFLPLDQAETDREYPQQTVNSPVQFSYTPGDVQQPTVFAAMHKGEVGVMIPVEVSAIPEHQAVTLAQTKATIEAPDGERWSSPWTSAGMAQRYRSGTSDSTTRFAMPRAIYDRLKGKPVRLRLSIAFEQEHETSSTTVALPDSEFAMPGVGICTPEVPWADGKIDGIHCRSAMRRPPLTYVTARWTEGECTQPESKPETETWLGDDWIGSTAGSWDFGLVSVWLTPVNLSNRWGNLNTGRPPKFRHLCPGWPITFSRYEPVAQSRTDLVVDNFQLPELRKGAYGASVAVHVR